MIQHSQGPIADRTREKLTTTDAAVVRFRSALLKAAAALENGDEPKAPSRHEVCRTRPGSWLAEERTSLEDGMLEKFQDSLGRVV